MRIHIREHNIDVTSRLRAHVQRRLGFALGRFGESIGLVTVRFSETNDHRGRLGYIDKRCQIEVALRPRSVCVEDTDGDAFAAVDHAAHRVSRSVARAIEREREWAAPRA